MKPSGGGEAVAQSEGPAGDPGRSGAGGNSVTGGGVAARGTVGGREADPVMTAACLFCMCHALWHRRENARLHTEHLNASMVLREEKTSGR